jgi:hypothetical protein
VRESTRPLPGKVLLPASTLDAARVKDGAKLMLMSSKGGVHSAGQAAAAAAAADKERKLAEAAALFPMPIDRSGATRPITHDGSTDQVSLSPSSASTSRSREPRAGE